MIEIQDLVKTYGAIHAVDHVSFTVGKGVILGLLGPNGAGKTTTMRMLTTSLPPSAGTAKVAGYDILDSPREVRRRIGFLPETPPLYLDMTVMDYLRFVADIKEVPRSKRADRIGEILEMTDIVPMAKRLVGHLSLGYRQRVGLAQALLNDPEVLVLDEPTRGLDPKQILEIRKLIKSLAGQKTIILSTHILPEVSSTCDEVVIIDQGKVVAADSVESLSQRLAGGRTLELEVKGPANEVESALRKVEGVTAVRPVGREGRGTSRFEVDTEGTEEDKDALFACIVRNKWVLRQMSPVGMSLEEVFLKLTTKEDAA